MSRKKRNHRRGWNVDRFGVPNHRPEIPAEWLTESATEALPFLIEKARLLKELKRNSKGNWGYDDEARLREAVCDVQSARRLKSTKFRWVEFINLYGLKDWTIEEDKS